MLSIQKIFIDELFFHGSEGRGEVCYCCSRCEGMLLIL